MHTYDEQYDVIVCGGGTSGVSAAIASARTGAKTLLIERLGALGGQMNVSGPPGFSYAHLFNKRGEQIMAGIIEETHARLLAEGHAKPHCHHPYREGSGYTFSFVDPEWWSLMIFEMMTENDVILLLHTLVVDVIKEEDTVVGVVVENANGRNEIRGKVVIECTGEGDIAVRAGCDWELYPKDEIQPHSLCFTMAGVDWEEFLKYVNEHPEDISPRSNLTEEQRIEILKTFTPENVDEMGEVMGWKGFMQEALLKGEWHPYSGVGFFMAPRPDVGVVQAHMQHSSQVPGIYSHDAWDLTKGEIICRQQVKIAINFFKKYIPGFKNAYVTRIGNEMRLREGRRIMCDYYLTSDDVAEGARFFDTIGRSGFAAGGHHVATTDTLSGRAGKPSRQVEDGGSHDIPYRCLVAKNVENLLIAGKHISTDRDAYHRFLQQTM
nr:FAD-dependent oxidoreductase [Clostridiales bacterium]